MSLFVDSLHRHLSNMCVDIILLLLRRFFDKYAVQSDVSGRLTTAGIQCVTNVLCFVVY